MAIKRTKAEKKQAYDRKLCSLLDEYTKVLIALADNVGSKQLQDIRRGLRGDSVVLMGKNTLIRRCIKAYADKTGNHTFDPLMDLLVGNVGLIFTKGDLKEVREEVAKYKVGAPARVGLVAPVDVVVPPGNTGLDPSQTSFFQVLNIPTKINKGTVEIITPVELIKKGDKVGSSESALLAKLGIRPFSYGLQIVTHATNAKQAHHCHLILSIEQADRSREGRQAAMEGRGAAGPPVGVVWAMAFMVACAAVVAAGDDQPGDPAVGSPPDTNQLCVSKCGTCPTVCTSAPPTILPMTAPPPPSLALLPLSSPPPPPYLELVPPPPPPGGMYDVLPPVTPLTSPPESPCSTPPSSETPQSSSEPPPSPPPPPPPPPKSSGSSGGDGSSSGSHFSSPPSPPSSSNPYYYLYLSGGARARGGACTAVAVVAALLPLVALFK